MKNMFVLFSVIAVVVVIVGMATSPKSISDRDSLTRMGGLDVGDPCLSVNPNVSCGSHCTGGTVQRATTGTGGTVTDGGSAVCVEITGQDCIQDGWKNQTCTGTSC